MTSSTRRGTGILPVKNLGQDAQAMKSQPARVERVRSVPSHQSLWFQLSSVREVLQCVRESI